ncbi:50S ribosomal protein L13 [Candidatus Geothermarchaeota archaeon ex4572_27]|nr:MAG: 50S ribosomal protein L13 [Candidatus Geothermarchaeota archaeon ex4572_27]
MVFEPRELVVNAEGMVAGRLASVVAKLLLKGCRVYVVNVEKALITGKRHMVIGEFMKKLQIRSKVNPRRHGPFKPRTPEGIFRRMVRGMLPRKKAKGKEAYRRLRVYRGVPPHLRGREMVTFEEAKYRKSPYGPNYMTLEEIARLIGWIPIEERLKMMGQEVRLVEETPKKPAKA